MNILWVETEKYIIFLDINFIIFSFNSHNFPPVFPKYLSAPITVSYLFIYLFIYLFFCVCFQATSRHFQFRVYVNKTTRGLFQWWFCGSVPGSHSCCVASRGGPKHDAELRLKLSWSSLHGNQTLVYTLVSTQA